jgi:hypothetical protein
MEHKNALEGEKAVIFLQHAFPEQIKSQLPITAMLIPRIVGGETPHYPSNYYGSSHCCCTNNPPPASFWQKHPNLPFSKILLKKAPCYYLNLGPDIEKIPGVIQRFLEAS